MNHRCENLALNVAAGCGRLRMLQEEGADTAALFDALRPKFERIANRHENGTAPRAVSAFNLFQTPAELAAQLVEMADLKPCHRVLEPSAGLGRLIREAMAQAPGIDVFAVDESPECSAELRREFPRANVTESDFLALDPAETGLFDRAVMNPPFKMRRDIRHIRHALTFLKPGGKLVSLCLDTDHRAEAFRDIADEWREIPAGTFGAEGTRVATILFSITA